MRNDSHSPPRGLHRTTTETDCARLVLFQQLFALLNLTPRLRACFRHLATGKVFAPATLFLQLVLHLVLGFRDLRDSRAYRDDPLVKRLLGLDRLPDVATFSRMLRNADAKSVRNLRRLLRGLLHTLQALPPTA